MSVNEDSDDFEYATSVESGIAIMRAIAQIRFRERLRKVMLMVARELVAAGVDLSRVDYSKITEPTDEDLNAVYGDLL